MFYSFKKCMEKSRLRTGIKSYHVYISYCYFSAVDFANRITIAVSDPVTADSTPPERSNNPIILENRHITSTTEINTW